MTTQPVRNNLTLELSYGNCNALLFVQLHVRCKLDGVLLRRRTRSQRSRKSQTGRHPKIDEMHSDRPTQISGYAMLAIIAWPRNPVSCSKTRASRAI